MANLSYRNEYSFAVSINLSGLGCISLSTNPNMARRRKHCGLRPEEGPGTTSNLDPDMLVVFNRRHLARKLVGSS